MGPCRKERPQGDPGGGERIGVSFGLCDRVRVGGREAQKWNRVGEPCGDGRRMSGPRNRQQEAAGGQRAATPLGDRNGVNAGRLSGFSLFKKGSAKYSASSRTPFQSWLDALQAKTGMRRDSSVPNPL